MIDFYAISTCLGKFYANRLENKYWLYIQTYIFCVMIMKVYSIFQNWILIVRHNLASYLGDLIFRGILLFWMGYSQHILSPADRVNKISSSKVCVHIIYCNVMA